VEKFSRRGAEEQRDSNSLNGGLEIFTQRRRGAETQRCVGILREQRDSNSLNGGLEVFT
jgi:hypothetical protein